MEIYSSKKIEQMLDSIQDEVKKDSFNLTRIDQDAICTKISELKRFIQELYEQHKCNV